MHLTFHRSVTVDYAPLGRAHLALIRITGLLTRHKQHKGLYRVARWLAHRVSRAPNFRITLGNDVSIGLPVVAYWIRMAVKSYEYEPELYRMLTALHGFDYQFVDCGANVGYWSVMVGHSTLGPKHGVAIEAGSQAFELLSDNLLSNGSPIAPLHCAIGPEDDQFVDLHFRIGEACDAGASIKQASAGDGRATTFESVPTITFDTLVNRHISDKDTPLVVKLDIEGLEELVIQTSSELMRRDCLLIVEDHGNDPSCRVSRALHERGFRTAYLDDAGGGFWYASLSRLACKKVNPGKGYNIVAVQRGSQFEAAVDEAISRENSTVT